MLRQSNVCSILVRMGNWFGAHGTRLRFYQAMETWLAAHFKRFSVAAFQNDWRARNHWIMQLGSEDISFALAAEFASFFNHDYDSSDCWHWCIIGVCDCADDASSLARAKRLMRDAFLGLVSPPVTYIFKHFEPASSWAFRGHAFHTMLPSVMTIMRQRNKIDVVRALALGESGQMSFSGKQCVREHSSHQLMTRHDARSLLGGAVISVQPCSLYINACFAADVAINRYVWDIHGGQEETYQEILKENYRFVSRGSRASGLQALHSLVVSAHRQCVLGSCWYSQRLAIQDHRHPPSQSSR